MVNDDREHVVPEDVHAFLLKRRLVSRYCVLDLVCIPAVLTIGVMAELIIKMTKRTIKKTKCG
jgi:hypothetical protein